MTTFEWHDNKVKSEMFMKNEKKRRIFEHGLGFNQIWRIINAQGE